MVNAIHEIHWSLDLVAVVWFGEQSNDSCSKVVIVWSCCIQIFAVSSKQRQFAQHSQLQGYLHPFHWACTSGQIQRARTYWLPGDAVTQFVSLCWLSTGRAKEGTAHELSVPQLTRVFVYLSDGMSAIVFPFSLTNDWTGAEPYLWIEGRLLGLGLKSEPF